MLKKEEMSRKKERDRKMSAEFSVNEMGTNEKQK